MKILFLIGQFPPDGCGGAEMQCWRQAKALAARGHQVTVLTRWQAPGSPRWETRAGVRIGRLGFYLPWMARKRQLIHTLRRVWRAPETGSRGPVETGPGLPPETPLRSPRWRAFTVWLANTSFILDVIWLHMWRRLPADVVHVHMAGWLAGFGQWLAEQMHIPVFCKEATFPVLLPEDEAHVRVAGLSAWQARRVKCRYIAQTDAIGTALAATGVPARQIVQIPNGVEVPSEPANPGRHADAIYIGNFTQGVAFKGFDVLLRAWGRAVQAEPDMHLHLYGAGKTQEWEAFARAQGCGDSVVFEGPAGDVWAVHRQAGFLVLPSRREGMSNALLEAMGSGLPAVVSDIPGNTAVVRNGVEGLVVPVDDAEALAAAMLTLYRSPGLRQQMGRAARARAQEKFALDVVVAQLEAVYGRARDEDAKPRKPCRAAEDMS